MFRGSSLVRTIGASPVGLVGLDMIGGKVPSTAAPLIPLRLGSAITGRCVFRDPASAQLHNGKSAILVGSSAVPVPNSGSPLGATSQARPLPALKRVPPSSTSKKFYVVLRHNKIFTTPCTLPLFPQTTLNTRTIPTPDCCEKKKK